MRWDSNLRFVGRIISIWAVCMAVAFSFTHGRLEALAPSSELREQWILEAHGNPKFKTYIVADPLYSLLTLTRVTITGGGIGLTVPPPGISRALDSSEAGSVVLDLVKKMGSTLFFYYVFQISLT